jgi:hypothetical protein
MDITNIKIIRRMYASVKSLSSDGTASENTAHIFLLAYSMGPRCCLNSSSVFPCFLLGFSSGAEDPKRRFRGESEEAKRRNREPNEKPTRRQRGKAGELSTFLIKKQAFLRKIDSGFTKLRGETPVRPALR